jgi:hypothetical protein
LLIIYGEEKMKKILVFLAVGSCTAFAQITITSSDVSTMFAVGNSATIHEDTLQSSVNIGSPGGGNNWDFTTLQSNLMVNLESVDPATTPYIGDFPGANICTYSFSTVGGAQTEIWSYSKINGAFDGLGNAVTSSIVPGFVTEIRNDPYRRQFEHPMTITSQWSHPYTQTLYVNGTPLFPSSVTLSVVVDAYGTMTIPGGASYEALRIRDALTISGLTIVSYSFVARNGAQVSVSAVDANPPTSGVISADGTTYGGALTTTGVEQISGLPVIYNLSQNYPNPFNPSTNIEYSIPSESFVELTVYDVLGNEVATLVNEEQSAGTYKADFSGVNLTSGTYFYRIQAGNFLDTRKMILLK